MLHDEEKITYFAQTDSRNRRVRFGIKRRDRSRHMYVIGKTGMGKSTLLENMAIQDIQSGEGMAFIDPHGKTAELLLDYVPESRIKDVLYFAPFDMEYPISFNVMEDVGPDRRHLVVNGLMSTFEKIWVDAWSARMAYILNNTLLALLEFPGATLLGINRMLSDKEYRKKVVENIKDPSVRSFWVDEFGKYTDKYAAEATPAIQNKVGQFTSNPLIRNIIGQPTSSFDMRKIMDERKIMIINLSKGRVGEGNANLLGSMLITKIYLAAMSRADATEAALHKLPNFYLYVDEFQSFANKSFADILSEARKYKLNLTITHQYIEQMEEEVRAAVFGNVGTMVSFRVGAFDAEVLEKEFAPQFTMEDLVNLGIYQIYLKLMIDGVGSSPFSATTLPPIERPAISFKDAVVASSRKTFGAYRSVVEGAIRLWHEPIVPTPKPIAPKTIAPKPLEAKPLQAAESGTPRASTVIAPSLSSQVSPMTAPTRERAPLRRAARMFEPRFAAKREFLEGESAPRRAVTPLAPRSFSEAGRLAGNEAEPKPLSLSHLGTADPLKKPKTIQKENLSELRSALQALLKDKDAPKADTPSAKSFLLRHALASSGEGGPRPAVASGEGGIRPATAPLAPPYPPALGEAGNPSRDETAPRSEHSHLSLNSAATEKSAVDKPQEVPEAVLRKLLKVDKDEVF